jgi:hypothetical protein
MAYESQDHIFAQAVTLQQENISMEYWFPAFPEEIITLDYSNASHATSQEVISSLINEIVLKEPGTFSKTTNKKRCAYCQYRSLCERGIQAGKIDDAENEPEGDSGINNLDFDQIEEIAF